MSERRKEFSRLDHTAILFKGGEGQASAFHIIPPLDLYVESRLEHDLEEVLGAVAFENGSYQVTEVIDGEGCSNESFSTTKHRFENEHYEKVKQILSSYAVLKGEYQRLMLPY